MVGCIGGGMGLSGMAATEAVLVEEPNLVATLANKEQEAALAMASTEARRFGISGRAFRRSVVAIDVLREPYQRALYRIERRTVSLALAPGGNRGNTRAIPDPNVVDPWSVDPATIEAQTRVSAICPDCDGSMRVTCDVCSGSTRARCDNCAGSGRVASQRKNQAYKNCPRCRGDGTRKCTNCRGGFVSCACCGATGVVTAWLKLESATISQVQVHPRNAAATVHYAVDDPRNFDAGAFVHTLAADTGLRAQPLPTVPALHPVVNAWTDRVLGTRLQTFSAEVRRIAYSTGLGAGHVDVSGRPPSIASSSNWEPLRWRRNTVLTTLLLGSLGAVVARVAYGARHEWYERRGDAGTVFMLACVTALAATALAYSLSAAARARSRVGLPFAMATTLLAGLASIIAFVHAKPSAAAARAALARSALADARAEAQAMIDLDIDRRAAELVLDELQVRGISTTSACHDIVNQANYPWHDDTLRTRAAQHVQHCTALEASAAFASGNADALDRLAGDAAKLAPAQAVGSRWLASVVRACLAIEHGEWSGAVASLQLVVDIGAQVPDAMKPPTFAALVVAARPLASSLADTERGSLRLRRQAVMAAIDQARAFVALTTLQLPDLTAELGHRADKLRRQLARNEQKAADGAAGDANDIPLVQAPATARDVPAATPSPPPAPNPVHRSGEVMNPY